MPFTNKTLLLAAALLIVQFAAYTQSDMTLWYREPAKVWTEALPVGNGRLGAMVFGGVQEELIQLNESSLWSGGPVKSGVNPESPTYLPLIRQALDRGEYNEANELTKKMQGVYSQSYLPLGDIVIRHKFSNPLVKDYYRDLNIRDAISTTLFTIDGTGYQQQVFVSAPDQVIVIHLSTTRKKQLNFTLSAASLLRHDKFVVGKSELGIKGKAPAHVDPNYYSENAEPTVYEDSSGCNGMRYEWRIKASSRDGAVRTDTGGIQVSGASDVVILLSAATSFNGFDKCPDKDGKNETALVQEYISRGTSKNFQKLLSAHLADYHSFFNRVSFVLDGGAATQKNNLPTDERLKAYAKGASDPSLETLYYQFGRYLLISSSRPGGMPANLQGIWNKELRAPWSSNYTININTQMNYWPAEVSNLSEMNEPLFRLIGEIAQTGKITAKEFYNARGWVANHNSDIWALSNPVGNRGKGDPRWANWPMAGNWLSRHLWEHYQYTQNKQFLKDIAYPLMKGAAMFCLDWLVEDKDGFLVTAPSTSPENDFIYAPGKTGNLAVASTMDMSIIWDLFANLTLAADVLGTDKEFRDLIESKRKKLFPLHIGKKGNLQEWAQDWEDVDPQHRHVSHLYGLFPGYQISPVSTPELAAAARKTLELRGDGGTGWSKAWKINFWARLEDGDHAYKLLRELLKLTGVKGTDYASGGGTYPNLFCAHPPFQIDGNFGGASGIAEMLIQSHLDNISLLPAIPSAWKRGQAKGLRARGGFEIGMDWSDSKLTKVTVKSLAGGVCTIRTKTPLLLKNAAQRPEQTSAGYLTRFTTEKGRSYELIPVE